MNLPNNNKKLIGIVFFILTSVMMLGENAPALMLEMRMEELASGADSIVVGHVLHRKSHWNRDKTEIFTRVAISTQECLKGSAIPGVIAIALPGGKVGDTTVLVTDTPDFSVGEKVVVFIRRLTDEQIAEDGLNTIDGEAPWFRMHGGVQGKFSVLQDKVATLPLTKFKERILNALSGEIPAPPENETFLESESVSSLLTITGITPSSASAGTNTQIAISGSNFGESMGTPFFYYKSNDYYGCPSCVSFWSDSGVVTNVPIFTFSGYPASAGSGPVYLMTPFGDKSNSFPFTVTFAYGGIKWPGDSPEVELTINPNGNDAILQAVKDAAGTWNSVAGKKFSFKYAGVTSADKIATNQLNEIIWAYLPDGIIGQASIRSSGGVIRECDIKFNTKYKWSTDTSTPKDAMDVHTVALHELGHWLNLRDLYGNVSGFPTDINKVMYGYGGFGIQKRILAHYDSMGIQYIYPEENACAASLSLTDSTYHLFIPIVDTNPNLWADLQYEPDAASNLIFRLINTGETSNLIDYSGCQKTTLSLIDGNYMLHIPELIFEAISYRVDLIHLPSADGQIRFMLSGVWTN